MSAALLLPNLSKEHDAAVAGLPPDVADAMMEWASDLSASVPQMMAWGRTSFPEAFGINPKDADAQVEKSPVKRGAKRAAKAAKPADAHPHAVGESHQNKEAPVKTPEISRPEAGESHQKPAVQTDAAASDDAPTSAAVTLNLTRLQVRQVADALREFQARRSPRMLPACRDSARHELERLAGVWSDLDRHCAATVTLPLSDWQGVTGERLTRPGVLGLLTAATVCKGDTEAWPGALRQELSYMLREGA